MKEVVFVDRTGFPGAANVQAVVHGGCLLENVELKFLLLAHRFTFLKALEGLGWLRVTTVRVLRELVRIARR